MAKRKRTRAPKRDTVARPVEPAGRPINLRLWGVLTAFCVAALLAYGPALRGQLIWDDNAHVTKPELQSLSGLYRIWFELGATQQYYPLLHSAFWLEHKLWGDSVLGYHLVNVLEHSLAAWLAYLVFRKLNIPGALMAAAIFLVHPVHVESVAWITEQKNTLSAVFYLGAMLAYLNFDESRDKRYYALALLLFVLGLLAKTVTATLPPVLLVIFWWQRGRISWRRDVMPLVPWFALGAAIGLFVAWVERTVIGAEGIRFELSLIDRGLLAGRVIWFYFAKLVWPTNLTFIYPRWHLDAGVWWQWLFPAAVLGVTTLLWTLRSKWRAPLAGWLIFVGTLFPVMGFLNLYYFMYSFVSDHFQYLASLGLIALVAAGLSFVGARLPPPNRLFAPILGFVLLAILGIMTWRQSQMYSNGEKLYQVTLERNPECWMAHNNLGIALVNRGMIQEALDHYRAALKLRPDYPEVHVNIGVALAHEDRTAEAVEHYRTALALQPNYAEAHNNLGLALYSAGRTDEAIDSCRKALSLKQLPSAHNNLGVVFLGTGKLPQARDEFQEAIKLQSNYPEAYNNLGTSFAQEGRTGEAIPQFQEAVRLNPAYLAARMNLAIVLLQTNEPQRALEHFQKALEFGADPRQVYFAMARAYTQMKQTGAANEMAQKALDASRAQNDTASIEQIEAWMKANPASLPNSSPAATEDQLPEKK